MLPEPHLPLIALGLTAPTMAGAWLRQRRTGNAGTVDVLWAASLGGLAVAYAVLADGWLPRRALVAGLVGAWSGRLVYHLARRVRHEPEDGRYSRLRALWGPQFQFRMFWIFQCQAALAVLLSLVFLALCSAAERGWRPLDFAAVALWLVALVGESAADRQLRRWRADPAHRGRTCRTGLWAYSRHPNYFFEWLHWLAYPLLGWGLPWGWALWLAPALMLFLVLRVTGIPPTEQQSLRSRGDEYRAYQRTTNAFFPGPRKRGLQEIPKPS